MNKAIIVTIAALTFLLSGCDDNSSTPAALQSIRAQVTPQAKPTPKAGIAFAVLLDTSGSMEGDKLRVAKQSVLTIVQQAADFSTQRHIPVEMTVYHFAALPEIVIPMGKPAPAAAADKVNAMTANGATGIGEAVIRATRQLNDSGYTNTHILLVTDGENTSGTTPEAVARAFKDLPDGLRPSVYLVAFDVNASVFQPVKEAGWAIYPAADGTQLHQTLDQIVGGQILLEKY
jgi:Mg-chelatase subunit ChlD